MKILFASIFFIILFNVSTILGISTKHDDDYVAAVISYTPAVIGPHKSPKDVVKENLKNYLDLIYETKNKNVDILVFPEATLNYWNFHNNRTALLENAVTIPDVNSSSSIPADDPNQSEIMREMSKKAIEHQMYILINVVEVAQCSGQGIENNNLHESNVSNDMPRYEAFTSDTNITDSEETELNCHQDGKILYNTNVVFDRRGAVVSKYRKFNLFNEKVVSTEKTPEEATFTTDFGITFGHFICFDIIFKKPAMKLVHHNIRHFLYPTLWFSELPFITAAQVQAAWAYGNNVVLLASGGNNPEYGSSGSGIYIGRHGPVKVLMSPNREKRVMIAKVPKNPDSHVLRGDEIENDQHREFSPSDMRKFHTEQFKLIGVHSLDESNNGDFCDDFLCCSYEFQLNSKKMIKKKSYSYKTASAVNVRSPSPDSQVKEAYCAILACSDECGKRFSDYSNFESRKFTSIKIQAKFDMTHNLSLLAMPSTLDTSLLPINPSKFEMRMSAIEERGKQYQVYTMMTRENTTLEDFLTFGVHARIYTGADNEENGGGLVMFSSKMIVSILVMTILRNFLC